MITIDYSYDSVGGLVALLLPHLCSRRQLHSTGGRPAQVVHGSLALTSGSWLGGSVPLHVTSHPPVNQTSFFKRKLPLVATQSVLSCLSFSPHTS